MKKFSLTLIAMSVISALAGAQTASEALRYSTFDVLGTARSVGTAGSMSALGGDFSVLNLNPAGIAVYRGSEFSITPAYFNNNTDASLKESTGFPLSNTTSQVLLANLGFVIATQPRDANWKTSNFAIGITKVADYHEQFGFRGSTPGSITDHYRELALGKTTDELTGEAALAYNTGAIYDFNGDLTYETDYGQTDGVPVLKQQSVESSGYNTELMFAYGANYKEQILFGVGIGVPILSYDEHKVYRETDENGTVPYFNALKSEEFLSTSGSGFNFKAGVIFKPAKWVNIGLAYHSRTRYALSDNFSSILTYDYTDQDNNGPIESDSPDGTFRYNLRTPSTLSGGLGFVIAKSGFIAVDAQYEDFGNAHYVYSGRGNGNAYAEEEHMVNQSITGQLSNALTIRTGGEVVMQRFRVRAGVELDQSPFVNDNSFDPTYNAGIGYRGDAFFIDLTYQHFTLDQGYLPYVVDMATQPFVVKNISNNRIFLTLAYRWQK